MTLLILLGVVLVIDGWLFVEWVKEVNRQGSAQVDSLLDEAQSTEPTDR